MIPPPSTRTILFALLLLSLSYSCSDDVKCTKGDYLFLRYMHNGQNAIFGDHAIIDRDSISFSSIDGELLPENLSFVDSTMAIRIFLEPKHAMYLLRFGDQHTDTV